MTTGIAPTGCAITDVAVIPNQTPISSSDKSSKSQEVSNKDQDAASVECSRRRRVHHRHCGHHEGRHCNDSTVEKVVDKLSNLTGRLGEVQSEIDGGELGAADLSKAQEHANKLTDKITKIVNSEKFKKAKETVDAVLEAYNTDGKEAALEIARENRGVLGHEVIHALKHGRIGRLERIATAFDTINSIVNPKPATPATPETPAGEAPAVEGGAQTANTAVKAAKSETKVAVPAAEASAEQVPAIPVVKDSAATETALAEKAATHLDLGALSKALLNARGALGRGHNHGGHHFGRIGDLGKSGGSQSLFDQKGLDALADLIKANQKLATAASPGPDPLVSLDLLRV